MTGRGRLPGGSRRSFALLLAAVAAGVAIGLVLLRGGDGEPAQAAPALGRDAIAAYPSMEPRTHLFHEPVTARLDLVFDRRLVAERTVRVTTGFAPYTTGAPAVERSTSGDLVRVRYRWRLECVTAACLPQEGGSSRFDFGLGRLDFVVVGQGRSAQPLEWPSLVMTARVGPVEAENAQWRANTARPPAVSYRVSAGALGAALLGGAVLLLAAAGALAWQLRPRRAPATASGSEAERRVSAIERALELALSTSQNGGAPEQRRALERLARELGAEGLAVLTDRARRLAWSSEPPARGQVEALAEDVRREAGPAA